MTMVTLWKIVWKMVSLHSGRPLVCDSQPWLHFGSNWGPLEETNDWALSDSIFKSSSGWGLDISFNILKSQSIGQGRESVS